MVSALPALSQKEWPLAFGGRGGHFFLPLEIVHVIWKVTKTAPPITASSCRTSLSVIEHPPFRVCVRGSKKVSPSSGALPGKERDHLHLQTAPFAAVQRQLQNNIKRFKIQRKKHPCVHRRTGAFFFWRFTINFRHVQSICTKPSLEVWQGEERFFQAIYLKIALSVVLSL